MTVDAAAVRRALDFGQFVPHFQPLVEIRTGNLAGFEVLARWKHPVIGMIAPGQFIPEAERDGWIGALTDEILRRAFVAGLAIPQALTLSVNVSPVQLRERRMPEQIAKISEETRFPLNRVVIEITESALTENLAQARAIAEELKAMGCKFALDDFGTGYSSLSHLQSLPFDELKIDRSFVGSMTQQRESRKIVAAVVGLGKSLGLTTVAEGVETREQAEMLLWLGCEIAQGWLYGKPVPAEDLSNCISQIRDRKTQVCSSSNPDSVSSGLESLPAQQLAQLRAVYDGAPVGLAFLDTNMRYISLNRRLAEMNGSPMEEHLGRTVEEMIPQVFPLVKGFMRRALNGESIPGVEITKPPQSANAGRSLLLSYEPARDEAGEVVGVSVSLIDITELKAAEKARYESEQHFRYMIELLPQIPWVIDAEGRALDVSQRWLDISGMAKDEWRGFGWLDALHPADRQPTIDAMQVAFSTGKPIDVIYRVRPRGGDWKRMRSRGAPRLGPHGKIICWYGSLEEVDHD